MGKLMSRLRNLLRPKRPFKIRAIEVAIPKRYDKLPPRVKQLAIPNGLLNVYMLVALHKEIDHRKWRKSLKVLSDLGLLKRISPAKWIKMRDFQSTPRAKYAIYFHSNQHYIYEQTAKQRAAR